ncbi:water chloroplastic-like [Stylonychia lemnae]|uniref:Water chloroplastic-like n=1 Tax=Stylonychia lemnae TaxID=5949 RepID=A0A078A9V7_STYLE|nr:water chloroplastic-like [Stylonychia lemnae]|eukprot:CDW77583.1 water chloroplastic-like [Stylonychia lemnae]
MQVRFRLGTANTKFGESVHVTGNIPQLSNWNAKQAPLMSTDASRYPQWDSMSSIILNDEQALSPFEYKYIINQNDNIKWEQGNNRVLNLSSHLGEKEVLIIDHGYDQKAAPKILDTIDEEEEKQSDISQDHILPAKPKSLQQNLQPLSTLVRDIIEELKGLNAEKGTWKQKLEIVAQLVDKFKGYSNFPTEGLAILSAYLYFVNSHQIKCSENGTHFRPNNHANIAYQLYQTLDRELTTEENTFIPSFADQYTQTVPLTRIRDIAHRGDIPQDLKNDIKHRLQNKLHRCADPGDLKTCEELIQRVRSGNYSGEFKQQFELFYEELKEFFNAMGLNFLLGKIMNMLPQESNLIQEFLNKKDSGQINENTIQVLTNLRKNLINRLNEILGDHNKKTLYQYLQLADIELEQFLFVKLSEILAPVQQLNSYDEVKRILRISIVAIDNMMLSGFYQNELGILLNELNQFGVFGDKLENVTLRLKRLKSTIERALRLGKNFTSKIIDTFQANVFDLGKQFNVEKHSIEVYAESFVRSHLIFQFSKSLELVIQFIRKSLNLPPYIIISQVLLETADGTEEIPNNVIGVLLKHDLPQLSHLAIRARQSGCIFVCCENDDAFNRIHRQVQGAKFCKMQLVNESVQIDQFSGIVVKSSLNEDQKEILKIEAKDLTALKQKFSDQDFDIVTDFIESNKDRQVQLLGSKSVNSLRLKDISQDSEKHQFFTPEQITVPMTVPQFLLMRDQAQYDLYQQLIDKLDEAPVYMVQPLREKIIDFLIKLYHQVAVRSSSTLEDLSKMAGAGLFDSYLNITLGNKVQLSQSIIDVWLSLFTERAIISRNQYKIPSSQAQMSVLIQQQIHSEFSFIIHTQNPVNKNQNEVYIEVAVGLGETLASANQSGTPYRISYDKKTEVVNVLSFANYQNGLFANKSEISGIERVLDYSKIEYSSDPTQLLSLGRLLGMIGERIESAYSGQAQDIEGAIVFENSAPKIYIVQTRNQV